jgi:hypothetical protein
VHFQLKKHVDNVEEPWLRSSQSCVVFAFTGEYSALADCRNEQLLEGKCAPAYIVAVGRKGIELG